MGSAMNTPTIPAAQAFEPDIERLDLGGPQSGLSYDRVAELLAGAEEPDVTEGR